MADELSLPRRRSRRDKNRGASPRLRQQVAFGVFATMVVLGPLAFGAVDRIVQMVLVVLLGVGLLAVPPRIVPLPVWVNRLLIALCAVLVVKEFLPAALFGSPSWRTSVVQSYGIHLPWTHHPEPGRAIDGWLAAAVGVVWFAWVRTLAIEREDRMKLAWVLLLAAAIVSAVSFATQGMLPKGSIYGLRFTPSWHGFGPFPNRNHTASFLAMGIVLGGGCIAQAAIKKRVGLCAVGGGAAMLAMLGLLWTESRGGLLALAVGLLVFLGAVVLRIRTKKAAAIAASAVVLAGVLALAAGATLSRFSGKAGVRDESVSTRIAVWHDALTMWREAPLFGHGSGVFASVFPMYQQIGVEEVLVKHPESSWLQWLTELGFIPVALGTIALVAFAVPHLRIAFERRTSFYVRIAGFAAVAALLVHALIDVPAHRWCTAGFALAALALACPANAETPHGTRRASLVPFGAVVFWSLPLWLNGPAWSTFHLARIHAQVDSGGFVSVREIERAVAAFPLDPALHMILGKRLLVDRTQNPARWQNEFRIAVRLVPSSWKICANVAGLCRRTAPSYALHYWQLAIERSSRQRIEVFTQALQETAMIPGAKTAWEGYVAAQTDLALAMSEGLSEEEGRANFEMWWTQRGSREGNIPPGEADTFLRLALRWGTIEQLRDWMRRHQDRRPEQYRLWAALLHRWGQDNEAWALLFSQIPEPGFPSFLPKSPRDKMEFLWRNNPEDIGNAHALAHSYKATVEDAKSEEVILAVAAKADAPEWFLKKAAHIVAKKQKFGDAVEYALRIK
jgi:O-antigen ligase